jgi:predicted Zn-dependent protease
MMAAEIYEGKGNETKLLEVLGAAKAKFPNDKRILNSEINYYLKSGKAEESIKKLKEGIAADPKNEYLYINLGQLMYNMANPMDKSGKFLPKPANSADLEKDAIANYNKALELNGNNYYPQYYLGLLYYNKAKEMTDEMNKADDKKYNAMKPERDNLINKAIPFLEKAKTLIDAEGVSDSNREVYKQSVSGLVQSYNLTNQTEKATSLQKLLNTK